MYAVAGVSGNTGSEVAKALLAEGQKVRVVVRNAEKGEPWRAQGAEVAVASLTNSEALAKALDGVDGFYFLVPPDLKTPDVHAHYRQYAGSLVQALARTPVPHVVYLSTIGANLENGPFSMHYQTEQRFSRTAIRFTFLRPAYFMENTLMMLPSMRDAGVLPSFFLPDQKLSMVATADIGRTAASSLLSPPAKSRVVDLTGPADYSMNEVASVFSDLFDKPITVFPVPEAGIEPAMLQAGASDDMARFFRNMVVSIEKGEIEPSAESGHVVRGSVTFEQFARAALGSS